MGLMKALEQTDLTEIGQELHRSAAELYPICRSITGDGIRRTLALIQKRIPLQLVEVPTGTLSSTGPYRKSGTFETPISRALTGSEWWTFGSATCTS